MLLALLHCQHLHAVPGDERLLFLSVSSGAIRPPLSQASLLCLLCACRRCSSKTCFQITLLPALPGVSAGQLCPQRSQGFGLESGGGFQRAVVLGLGENLGCWCGWEKLPGKFSINKKSLAS